MSSMAEILNRFADEHMVPSKLFDAMIAAGGVTPQQDDPSFYSPIYPDFVDFNAKHDQSISTPIYLNDFDFNIEEDRQAVVELLRTEYEGNNFDTVASCACKKYRSNIYLGSGFVCEDCGHEVTKPLANKIETKVWLKLPARVEGFISPAMYAVFLSKLNTKSPKVNIVDYWVNPDIRNENVLKIHLTTRSRLPVS